MNRAILFLAFLPLSGVANAQSAPTLDGMRLALTQQQRDACSSQTADLAAQLTMANNQIAMLKAAAAPKDAPTPDAK